MERRTFIRLTVTALGAGAAAAWLPACGGATVGPDSDLAGPVSAGPQVDGAEGADLAHASDHPDLAMTGGDLAQASPDLSTGGSQPADMAATTSCAAGAKASSISANHGHSLLVPAAHFVAPVERSYSIMGASGHDHTLTLSAASFATLASGQSVVVTATTGAGHTHVVTVACA